MNSSKDKSVYCQHSYCSICCSDALFGCLSLITSARISNMCKVVRFKAFTFYTSDTHTKTKFDTFTVDSNQFKKALSWRHALESIVFPYQMTTVVLSQDDRKCIWNIFTHLCLTHLVQISRQHPRRFNIDKHPRWFVGTVVIKSCVWE